MHTVSWTMHGQRFYIQSLTLHIINSMFFELINRFLSRDEYLKTLGLPRSSEWRVVREKWLKDHPQCAVCGSTKDVVPHHIVPFHVDPSLELDLNNLITLCETKSFNCHLFFGHFKHWTRSNPNIKIDAEYWKSRLKENEHNF